MLNLGFFPTPYPNEDFRSVVYRYHYYENGTVYSKTIQQLFGLNTFKIRHLPRNLGFLGQRVPRQVKIADILLKTTLLRLFQLFTTKHQSNEIIKDILYGDEGKTSLAGVLSGSSEKGTISENISYCLECLNDDYKTYGECFVHKYHQVQYINVCYKHNLYLISRCPTCDEVLSRSIGDSLLCKPECPNGHLLSDVDLYQTDTLGQLKYGLIRDIIYLTENDVDINAVEMSQRFLACLGERGYIHSSGIVYKTQLLHDFFEYYSESILIGFGQKKNKLYARRTIKRLFNPEYMNSHILFYILLMRFLEGSVEKFLNTNYSFALELPFESGPWECRNPNCSCYPKKTIKSYKMIQRGGYISGEFECKECGYTYIRKKRFKNNEQDETLFIVTIGFELHDQIQGLFNVGWNTREISKQLNISETTVAKYSPRKSKVIKSVRTDICEDEILKGLKEVSATVDELKRIRIREVFRHLLHERSTLSRTDLKKLHPVQYNWLSKYDKAWFEKNMTPACKGGSRELDLGLIDLEISNHIKSISKQIFHENPVKQIKPYTILARLSKKDIGRYGQYKSSLPLSQNALSECAEQKIDYLIRILPKMVEFLKGNRYQEITFDSLKIRRGYRHCTSEERLKIEAALRQCIEKI
ncbi:TnsD family transposase [Paenibacillus periandrae]|uniref:TnsD family transposase n=1 Tax=Paenibacillus periandrae TaxID=1761741 RepID=UPI001F0958E6|nr:TnsD family transposase [Paenibacillus periandrae]